jgi:hypothetical protein
MFGLTAFDSARASMEQSSFRLGLQDRQTSVMQAAELVNFYEGNQRRYLEEHIDTIFKSQKLRERYKSLIFFANITSLIVDRVAIMGKRKAEIKFLKDDGTPNEADQKLWDRISKKELDHGGFDAFLGALGKYKELCKTVVAVPFWDSRANRLRLRFYTPNLMDVAWDVREGDPLAPQAYRILLNDQQSRWRVYDFTDPENGVTYEAHGEGNVLEKIQTRDLKTGQIVQDVILEAKDPATGLTLVPFVPFRTRVPTTDYFVDDGQGQMVEGQRSVNRLWTGLMGLIHFGSFQVPILTGPGWTRQEGKKIELTYDPGEGIAVPSREGDTIESKIHWAGPANEAFIEKILKTIGQVTETVVSTFHISPNEVVAKADAASGVSLFIGNSALKEKQEAATVLDEPSLEELVYKMAVVWNAHAPIAKGRFSLTGEISAKIPQQPMSLEPMDEVKRDALMVEESFVLHDDIIKKYNPGATPEQVAAIKAQKQTVGPPSVGSLFRSTSFAGNLLPQTPGAAPVAKPASPGNSMKPQPPTIQPSARGGAVKPAGPKPGTNTGP